MSQNTLIQDFLKFCIISLKEYKQVTFNEYPKLTLTVNKSKVETLASFNPSTNEIICYTPKRLVADVFRSIAHEMVHFAQNVNQELSQNSGDTGSDIENEANSLAGVIMRDFGKKFPQIFVTSFEEILSIEPLDKVEKLLQRKYENPEQIVQARDDMDNHLKSLFPITENENLNEYGKDALEKLFKKWKLGNDNLTEDIFNYYIGEFMKKQGSPKVTQKDITQYTFKDLEKLIDSFPTDLSYKKPTDGNDVEFSDTELIYNKAPLQIFHGDSPKQCVKMKGDFQASWCISRTVGNMYNNYRFAGTEPSFYFVKNLERLNKITQLSDDPYCFFVVQINNQGNYIVTNSLNNGDNVMTWEQVLQLEPLLNGTDKLFVQNALSDEEKAEYKRFKNGIDDEAYTELSYKDKQKYIAITNDLNDYKFENSPNELLNDYITTGVELTNNQFEFIKDKKSLFNNYRRVTLTLVLPEYLNGRVNMGARWLVLTEDEIMSIYKKYPKNSHDILMYKPNLIEYFKDELDKFSMHNIAGIIKMQPQLAKYFKNKLHKFYGIDIRRILIAQPSLIEYFKDGLFNLDEKDIALVLSSQPSLIEYFKDEIDRLNITDITYILIRHPDLIKYFEDKLYQLDSYDMRDILEIHPNFISYFKDRLDEFYLNDVLKILIKQPSLIEYFKDRLSKLSKSNIIKILSYQPNLIDYFKSRFSEFDRNDISDILEKQPQLAKYFKKNDMNELIKQGENILDKSNQKYEYGCLMLDLKFKNWDKFVKSIPEDKLYKDGDKYGRELEPHCTVLYGFDENANVEKIKKSLQTLKNSIKLSLNKIDIFENEKFDVVKLNVVSTDLHKLHKIFATNFDNNEQYPDYAPHVTIAYVKKGFGKEFVKNLKEPIELSSKSFTYSEPNKSKHTIVLNECDCEQNDENLNEYGKDALEKLFKKWKLENDNLTVDIFNYYVGEFMKKQGSPKVTQKDITQYTFKDLEKLIDSFPTDLTYKKPTDGNDVEFSDTELIYNKAPLQILHGDSPRQCVKMKGDFQASWCISRTASNMYNNYRFAGTEPSFYFVKNLERLNKIKELSDDPYCFFVVQINNRGKYIVTSAKNDGDKAMTWEQVLQIEPLLNGTDKLFVQKALSDEEKVDYHRFKNDIHDDVYKELSYKDKQKYLAINSELNNFKFKNTPDELINDYITTGATLTDYQLGLIKDKKSLLNNYRRVTVKNIIPLYLKGTAKMNNRWAVLSDEEAYELYNQMKPSLNMVLTYKPTLVKYFKDKLNTLSDWDVSNILSSDASLITSFEDRIPTFKPDMQTKIISSQPSLIKYFEKYIPNFYIGQVDNILATQPSLIPYFENRIDGMSANNIEDVIKYQPSLINYFEKYLYKLKHWHVAQILTRQASLISYFKKYISEFTIEEMTEVVTYSPNLIKYFEPKLMEIRGEKIGDILLQSPMLIEYFVNRLDEISTNALRRILQDRPKLVDYFKPYLHKIDSDGIDYLLKIRPELAKYFEKLDTDNSEISTEPDTNQSKETKPKPSKIKSFFRSMFKEHTNIDMNELTKLGSEYLSECDCDTIEDDEINELLIHINKQTIHEAQYQGKSISLNKPSQGDVKKFKVYVKNKSGKVVKVNFGSKEYNIKKSNPDRKKSYCARSKGIEGGGKDKTKANYWSRRAWNC